MDFSFKEKSAWISLFATLGVFGYYLINLVQLGTSKQPVDSQTALSLLLQAIFLSVIIETVFHSILAVGNRKGAAMGADERDKLIELKANQLGYRVLSAGVILVLGRMVLLELFFTSESPVEEVVPLLTFHLLMFSFIASEVARFATQIFFYRRSF